MAKKKQEALVEIPPRGEVDEFTENSRRDAEASLVLIEQLQIQKPADREFASNALSEIAHRLDVNEAKRHKWVDGLKAITSDIDATFRPAAKALKRAIEILKGKIGEYDVSMAQARSKLLQDAVTAMRTGDVQGAALQIAAAEEFVQEIGGASSKIEWTGEVIDAEAIPREYLVPDLVKLQAITKALGTDPKIPGWHAFETASVRTSRKGIA